MDMTLNPITGNFDLTEQSTSGGGGVVNYNEIPHGSMITLRCVIDTSQLNTPFYFENTSVIINRRIIPIHCDIHGISGPFNGSQLFHAMHCFVNSNDPLFNWSTEQVYLYSVEQLDRQQFYTGDLRKSYLLANGLDLKVVLSAVTDSACLKEVLLTCIILDN